LKRIFSITFLNFFVSGGLTLIIPLLLLERKIDLIEISMIISVLPLVFFIVRVLLAAFADLKGWRRFYLLINWPATFFSTLIYAVANSTSFFLFGKIIEAVKESSYWGVNRTAIFSLSPNKKEKEATRNSAILALATAIGSAAAGIGIAYFGFSIAISFFIIASFIIGLPAILLWRTPKQKSESKTCKVKDLLNSKNRGRKFWFVSFILLFFSLARYPLLYLLLPIFMVQELGYSYITIGIAYMLYNLISSSVTFVALKTSLGLKRVIFQSSIAIFASFLLSNSLGYFLVLFLFLAVAEGLGMGFFESIIAKSTKKSICISVDIGLLHIPMRLSEFFSILYAGFIAQSIGYMPIFVLSGIFFSIFSISSWYFLKKETKEL
jgi:MFS family permease